MKQNKIKTLGILTVLASLILIPQIPQSVDEENINWDQSTPSEIHRKMAADKAASLKKSRQARLAASTDLINTQTNYDVLFYDIVQRIDDTALIIDGSVRFTAEAEENNVSQVQIDLYRDIIVDSIVDISGTHLAYTRNVDVIELDLLTAYNISEQFDFTIYYYGHPTEGGFQAFSFGSSGGYPMMSSLSEPYYARTWWPCKDRMDDKADSFNIEIQVDTALYVASNGTLDSTIYQGDNTHTFYYRVRYPMVTYLYSLAITKYTVWYDEWIYNDGLDTLPIVNAVYPANYNYSLPRWGVIPDALDIFAEDFGLYPFLNEKYGHANFNWGGGMEHQTMTSMSGSSFGYSEPVVVHELAHQWWGDMITCESWGHIWLNEGWASYAEALYYEAKYGWANYHSYMNSMIYTGDGTIYVYDTTSVSMIFHGGRSYDKGAWVCHMLRGVLGDSLFFAGIEAYYNSEYKHGAATTENLRDVFEEATGVELDWFFEQWIYGTYYPNYRFAYWKETSDTAGYDLYLKVWQTQVSPPQVYQMPIDFAFDLNNGTTDTVTLAGDEREKLFRLNFDAPVDSIKLDPSGWILKNVTENIWWITIVSLPDELTPAVQSLSYNDTIQYRGIAPAIEAQIMSGVFPGGLTIGGDGIITGATNDTGWFNFSVRMYVHAEEYSEPKDFTLYVAPFEYIPGDLDLSGEVDISDLVMFVDYIFNDGSTPMALNSLDVDGSCEIDIADIVYMVDFFFNDGNPLLHGCVN